MQADPKWLAAIDRYPWALASINVTWWCVSLAKRHQLQFFLLSSCAPELSHQKTAEALKSAKLPDELHVFLVLQTKLTFLFHSFWRRIDPPPNVMQFEAKFKLFKEDVELGLAKGLIGGPRVGWIEEIESLAVEE